MLTNIEWNSMNWSIHVDSDDLFQALTLLPSGTEFLSAGNDMIIRKWNIENASCVSEYKGHEAFIYTLSILPR